MAKKKTKVTTATPTGSVTATAPGFPLAQYSSIVGVHTTLLTFTALFLPRTTNLFPVTTPLTSQDRPQHPFLEALTAWWGGWLRGWWTEESKPWVGRVCLDTFAASIVIHVILVLFGAPLSSLVPQTYLLSLLLSLLIVFPPLYSLGAPLSLPFANSNNTTIKRLTWVRLFAELSPRAPVERAFVYPAIGALLGSWFGVIPIALDWDRPWQAYPLPPAYAALLGYIVASLVALTVSATRWLADEGLRMEAQSQGAKKDR
ncbi:hypothetical protein H0H92_014488 [Tricholoma furcatifolium]|nr:hypothetical protein H0H92_014488 [Tricholoma furcatifolium]